MQLGIINKGIFWNLIERFGNQFLRFTIGVFIARLLTPSDYGLFGIVLSFLVVFQIIIDGGYSIILINSKVSKNEFSTVFWMKIIFAIFFWILLFFLSPLIAEYFNNKLLIDIIKVISFTLVLNSFSSVYKIWLTKKMNFKLQANIILISTLIGGIFGLYFAYSGMGVWAIVYQSIIISSIQVVLFLYTSKWLPSFNINIIFLKNNFINNFQYLISNLLLIVHDNLFIFLGAKFYGPATIGFYTRANQFQSLPVNTTNSVIQKVLLSDWSSKKNDLILMKNKIYKTYSVLSYVLCFTMSLLFLNSQDIILIILNKNWLAASYYLKPLSIFGLVSVFNAILYNILNVYNKPNIRLYLYGIKVFFYVFHEFGGVIVVYTFVLSSIIEYLFLLKCTKKIIDFDVKKIFMITLKPLIISCFAVLMILQFDGYMLVYNIYKSFLLNSLSFISVFIFLTYIFKLNETLKLIKIIKIICQKCYIK